MPVLDQSPADPQLITRLEGKVALITGGASGIGKAIAKLFARCGARVVVADIQDDLGQAVCQEIAGLPISTSTTCSYVQCDVTDESDVKRAVDTAVDAYGKLDVMVNNAGIIGSTEFRIIYSDKSNFEKVMSVNVTGCYLGTKHAARVMIPVRSGSIISIASVASVNPCETSVAYTCSKHAVVGLTKSAAVELGQFGIRVNCVSPYGVATPLATKASGLEAREMEINMEKHATLKGVRLKANDVAQAVMYLGSDQSRYVSGLNLVVDGAFSVGNPSFGFFKYALHFKPIISNIFRHRLCPLVHQIDTKSRDSVVPFEDPKI